MKLLTYIAFFLLQLFLLSCGKAPQDKRDILPPDPESKVFTSKRVPANMVDYIFYQMSDTSALLKAILDNDEKLSKDLSNWEEMLADYNKYEETYLKSAFSLLEGHQFADTLLRDQIIEGLQRMKQRQTDRITWIGKENKEAAGLQKSKQDRLVALKILCTMPVLETYLTDHMPDSSAILSLKEGYRKQMTEIELQMRKYQNSEPVDSILIKNPVD